LVRTFSLIENALHWSRGALLRYGQATAKVWATQDERWLYATISGSQEVRDDLTMMLRQTLRVLFADYKNLSVVEQMEWNGRWVPHATLEEMGLIPADEMPEVTPSISPKDAMGAEPDEATKARPMRMFVSYSHENAAWRKRLLPVLKVMANVDTLQPWHDTELKAGDRWDKEIRGELERMDIFLCLVSYQFLASDYIQKVELERAKVRHKNGEIEVVPVVLYPVDLKHDCEFLSEFNPLPKWGKCWRDYGDYNVALHPIGEGVKQAIEKARLRSAAR